MELISVWLVCLEDASKKEGRKGERKGGREGRKEGKKEGRNEGRNGKMLWFRAGAEIAFEFKPQPVLQNRTKRCSNPETLWDLRSSRQCSPPPRFLVNCPA
jgi:hypothetical protein